MNIGMVLQDNRLSTSEKDRAFYDTLENAKRNKMDLLVFPEHMYCPEDVHLSELAFLCYGDECDQEEIIEIFQKYATIANCPIVVSRLDKYDYIYGLFVSPFSDEVKWYGKHIATFNSTFDLENYEEAIEEVFQPIECKGYKIGLTICYDSNKPLFSKAYEDIDILLNLTGGHVDYKKWSIYQRARALENKCYNLCTMAYFDNNAKNKSYVFGFDGFGKSLDYRIINNQSYKNNDLHNGLYVFQVNKKMKDFEKYDSTKGEIDKFINGKSTISKNITSNLSEEDVLSFLIAKNKINDGLYITKLGSDNLVIINTPKHKIEDPIIVEKLMYNNKLKNYNRKKYLILNTWDYLEHEYYQKYLSTILKVRAAENFCIVMCVSKTIKECIQVGLNKNIQIVKCVNGKYGLDFKRATGPESFWRNNPNVGVRKDWREQYEMLIDRLTLL